MNNKNKVILLLVIVIMVMVVYSFKSLEPGDDFVSQLPIPHFWDATRPSYTLSEHPYDKELQKDFLVDLQGKEKLPRFEDFPATYFSDNKDIVVDVNSDPIGRTYPTAIRYGVKYHGINFAGKYSIAKWGCGSTCQDGAMVDADTGHIYPLPSVMSNGYEARKNSRLLIQNPVIIGGDWTRSWYRILYWEWMGNSFRSLGMYKVDLATEEIVKINEDIITTLPLWAQLK